MSATRSPLGLTLWLAVCASLNAAGWTLSALGQLNRAGYIVALALLGVVLWQLARGQRWKTAPRSRWRRALPAAWLALAALVWLGGILHAPNNYDALAYRVPRVLHWLAEGHWHWIHTDFVRLNPRSAGYEWLMAPAMALLGSERWTWLFNGTAFLLLPGLIFSVFTRLGVPARAAWRWMWVIPGAYGFALQAGGIGNDFSGVVPAMAMMHFALRLRDRGAWEDLAGALVAGGFMTGVKASNLVLLLPAALAMLPRWRVAVARPFATLGIAAAAMLVSFFPTAVLNWKSCGDWTGARYEQGSALRVTPGVGIVGNAIAFTAQNLNPPILPGASRWSEWIPRLAPEPLRTSMVSQFEAGAFSFVEMPNEESAGFGFGASLLVLASIRLGRRSGALVRWSPWVSLLVYMASCGIGGAARIIIPYYLLLVPALVAAEKSARFVQRRGWRNAALLTLAIAAGLVVLTPSRPLWPVETGCAWLAARFPHAGIVERMRTVYSVYANRADALAAVREALPAGEKRFGLVTRDDLETSLWRPFGSRRFRHVTRDDTVAHIRASGLRTIVVSARDFETHMGRPFTEWLRAIHGEVTATFTLRTRAGQPPWDWHLVRLTADDGVGKAARMP